jgi:hypothetical protein
MKETTAFEVWMRNQVKKQKNTEDQEILDQMLEELRKKNEAHKQHEIYELTEKLEKARG